MKSLSACGLLAVDGNVTRIYLASILLLSGTGKLMKRGDLTPVLQALGLRLNRSRLLTTVLILCEISTGVWLLTGLWLNGALVVTSTILLTFTFVLFGLVQKAYNGPCACFGSLDRYPVGRIQITRNLFLTSLSLFATIESFQYDCDQPAVWELPPETFLVVGVGLVLTAILYYGLLEIEDFRNRARRITHNRYSHLMRID